MLEILLSMWKNRQTVVWVVGVLGLAFYMQKAHHLMRENERLTTSIGAINQQVMQQQATIASLSSQKAIADEIAAKMNEGIAKSNSDARIALQRLLQKPLPKDCKGSIDYLKNEAGNVKFD